MNSIYQFFRFISLNSQLGWTILNFCLKIPLLVTVPYLYLFLFGFRDLNFQPPKK